MTSRSFAASSFVLLLVAAACGGTDKVNAPPRDTTSPPPDTTGPLPLAVAGQGTVADHWTAEISVRGTVAYTTTWGNRDGNVGNQINVWNVAGPTPQLVRTIGVSDATTLGDVQVSDDGTLLVVATERAGGSIVVYDLADPTNPVQLSRYSSSHTTAGVHTAEVQRVDGTLYAFLSVDPTVSTPGRLTIVDLSIPGAPREVYSQSLSEIIHDVFVRDGILFTALWDDGLTIWDVGGAGQGGTPASPVWLGNVHTRGGSVHNVWWFHDPTTGSKRYAFVGEEGPMDGLSSSTGDIHVVDVSDFTAPREVAFYHVAGAGPHNFSMDEARGVLYSAYYNAGVRAIDVRGDLDACDATQRDDTGRCDLVKMQRELATGLTDQGNVFIWGVQREGDYVYASDMVRGIWKLAAVTGP